MFGIILASVSSGAIVSRTGHYYTYPIVGSALLTIGSGLLKLFEHNSGQGHFIPIMFIGGLGVGFTIQLVLLAAQNSVEMKDLGVTTSTVIFFRTIGK